jgi:hypothetical protein
MKIDSFRASLIGLVLSALLVAALIAWFFLARVTLYEYSTALTITDDGQVLATFRPESMPRVRIGQSGLLRLDLGEELGEATLPVLVIDKRSDQNQVELLVMDGQLPDSLAIEELVGQVEVEAEYISPARLVMRASGQFLNSDGRMPVSPQRLPNEQP